MFVKWLLDYGFVNVDNDGVTSVKNVNNDVFDKWIGSDGTQSKILLSIHVDDGLVACSDEAMYKEFIAAMRKDFDLSDSGDLKRFLGDRSSRIVKRA